MFENLLYIHKTWFTLYNNTNTECIKFFFNFLLRNLTGIRKTTAWIDIVNNTQH